ncbi:MAG TPA: ESX secretion-associated protein EspG [Jatrophihabitans sp.]|jgi:hypothetical protein
MTETRSGIGVDWVSLSTPEFVAWTRARGLALPFPLGSGALGFVPGPDRDQLTRLLAERELTDSPVLAATASAFSAPRLSVYAVRARVPDADETKFFSVASRDDRAVLLLLDAQKVAVREIADTELAAGVVGALPPLTPLRCEPCEVSVAGLRDLDAAIESGASARTLRAQMSHLGLTEDLILLRERVGNAAATSGALGAMAYGGPDEPPRHSARSATWREYDAGTLLQVERGRRQGQPVVLLTGAGPDALFRAAVDAVASCYETGG